METEIIFLDTSVFETENFFKGHKLLKIAELSKTGIVNVKITHIVHQEVKSRMLINLKKASSSIRKAENLMDNEAKILKNLDEYSPYYPIKRLDIEEIHKSLCERFDKFLEEHKIEVVGLELASIGDVFDKYFLGAKPFGEGKKKFEFPDAFSLDIITKWCKDRAKRAYVLSVDGDIGDYECPDGLVISVRDIPEFLEILVKREKDALMIEVLSDKIYDINEDITNHIKEYYLGDITYDLNQKLLTSSNFDDVNAYEFEIDEIEINEAFITFLNEEKGLIIYEIEIQTNVEIPIDYYDYDGAWYDKEDDTWFGRNRIDKKLESEIKLKFEAVCNFEFDEDKLIHFELDDINNLTIEDFDYDDL